MGVKGKAMHKGQRSRQRQKEINRRKDFAGDRIRRYIWIDKIIQSMKIMKIWYWTANEQQLQDVVNALIQYTNFSNGENFPLTSVMILYWCDCLVLILYSSLQNIFGLSAYHTASVVKGIK